jgi:transposase-like protein
MIKWWGAANGLQRDRCKDCQVTSNAQTGTPLAQLHQRELWSRHTEALVDGIALLKVVKRLDIALTTAFRWRNRFVAAPKTECP